MRQDARSLLERLGRKEFRYQEFDDPFADMELWPIFEALLRDDAVVGAQASTIRMTEIQFRSARAPEEPAGAAAQAKATPAPSPIFARYAAEPQPAPAPEQQAPVVDMRQFFGRFSEGQ